MATILAAERTAMTRRTARTIRRTAGEDVGEGDEDNSLRTIFPGVRPPIFLSACEEVVFGTPFGPAHRGGDLMGRSEGATEGGVDQGGRSGGPTWGGASVG